VSQLRRNPLNGRWVTIASERSARPGELVSDRLPVEPNPLDPCPFCPGNEGATPPALETYGPQGTWAVRVVPNDYPAFNGSREFAVDHIGPLFAQAPGSGIHEVFVLTPDHDASWADLADSQVAVVMAALRDRMEAHQRLPKLAYTQAIVNHGREAGASIEHPHGQLLAIPFVPSEIESEITGFHDHDGECLVCDIVNTERAENHRVVVDSDNAVVVCPYWSGTPFELLVIPTEHQMEMCDATPRSVVGVGKALRDSLVLLRDTVGDVAYNIVFHTAPPSHHGSFHWHAHVLPRITSLAGFEQGTGVLINIVAPEHATQQLRSESVQR
jgi:UDPglucose--hexose-1-phosphate uridylyltransferase